MRIKLNSCSTFRVEANYTDNKPVIIGIDFGIYWNPNSIIYDHTSLNKIPHLLGITPPQTNTQQ